MRGTISVVNLENNQGKRVCRAIVPKTKLPDNVKVRLIEQYRNGLVDYNTILNTVDRSLIDILDDSVIDDYRIPFIKGNLTVDGCSIKSAKNKSNFYTYVKDYNPMFIFKQDNLIGSVSIDVDNWLMFGNMPLCSWKPYVDSSFNRNNFIIEGNVLKYQMARELYLLLEGYARHKKVVEEEILTVNLQTGEARLYISTIRNKLYLQYLFIFNMNLRKWMLVNKIHEEPVLGFKHGDLIKR